MDRLIVSTLYLYYDLYAYIHLILYAYYFLRLSYLSYYNLI